MVYVAPDLPGSDLYTEPWVRDPVPNVDPQTPQPAPQPIPNVDPNAPPPPMDPVGNPTPAPAVGTKYPPAIEKRRPLIQRYFRPEDVDKAMYVSSIEDSADDPAAFNMQFGATGGVGLFQDLPGDGAPGNRPTAEQLQDPETNVREAARLLYGNAPQGGMSRDNPTPAAWSNWGEGQTWTNPKTGNVEPWGALGWHPYDANSPLGTTVGSVLGMAVGNAVKTRAVVKPSFDSYTPQTGPEDEQAPEGSLRSRLLKDRNGSSAYSDIFPTLSEATKKTLGDIYNAGVSAPGDVYNAGVSAFHAISPASVLNSVQGDNSYNQDDNIDPLQSVQGLQQYGAKVTRNPVEEAAHNEAMKLGGGQIDPTTGKVVPGGVGSTIAGALVPNNLSDQVQVLQGLKDAPAIIGDVAHLATPVAGAIAERAPAVASAARGAFEAAVPETMPGSYFAGVGRGNNLEREVAEQAARDAAAGPPQAAGAPGEPASGEGIRINGLPHVLPSDTPSGIVEALRNKAEATQEPGSFFGDQGSIQRRAVGALNPAVDMPSEVHIANQSLHGVQSALRSELGADEIPAYRRLQEAFEAEKPTYTGPEGRPAAGTWIDYGEHPGFYDDSPELRNTKEDLRAAQDRVIERVQKDYGVDVKPFHGEDPESVYIPHMQSREDFDQAVRNTEQSLSSRGSVTKTRAYDSLNDRMARQPDFKPEMDAGALADLHSNTLANVAAHNTFKAGVGGKTLPEVIDEMHPGLRSARDRVAARVQAMKDRIDLAERRIGEHGAVGGALQKEQDKITQRATSKLVEESELDKRSEFGRQSPELVKLNAQIGELKIRANSLDRALRASGNKGLAAELRLNDASSQLGQLKPELDELRQRYNSAGTGKYELNKSTYRYHEPKTSKAISDMMKTRSFGNAFLDTAIEAGNKARQYGLGPDISPLTIQGALGAASHPGVAIANGADFFRVARDPEALKKLVDPDVLKRFEFATGRRLDALSEDLPDKASKFFGREMALPGRPVKNFNDMLNRIVDFGTLKAFEHDSALLQKWGESQNIADHEAANSVSKFIPRINNAETARNAQRVALEGVLPTSRSFLAQPFSLAKDFTSGLAKVTTGHSDLLLGREKLALYRGMEAAGVLWSMSVGSALASSALTHKSPTQAVREVVDPDSPRFFSVIVGNGGSVPIGGPFRRAFLGVYKTAGAPVRHSITGEQYQGKQGLPAALSFGRNSLQPELGAQTDALQNRDWRGRPIMTGSALHQLGQWAAYSAENANITAGSAIQGFGEGGLKESATQTGTGLLGVNYNERSPTEAAMTRLYPGKTWDELLPTQQDSVRNAVRTDPRYAGPTDAKSSFDRETAKYDTEDQDAIKHWHDATLPGQSLPEIWGDIGKERRAANEAVEADFASSLKGVPASRVSQVTQGYYDDKLTVKDPQSGKIDWDATFANRLDFVNGLSTRKSGNGPSDREIMDDWLQKVEGAKTSEHQDYDKYIQHKKDIGYFKPGLTQEQKAELDQEHPDVDVDTWKWYGGIKSDPGAQDDTPTLNSAEAVDLALKDDMAGNRPVKLAGMSRAVNETPGTLDAWDTYGKRAATFLEGYKDDAQFNAQRVPQRNIRAQRLFGKPYAQLEPWQQKQIEGDMTGDIKTAVRNDSPDLEAYLAWMGAVDSVSGRTSAFNTLKELRSKYGLEPLGKDGKPITFR